MSGLILCVLAAGAAVSAAAVGYVLTPRLARRRARRERREQEARAAREQETQDARAWLAVEGRLALDLEGEFRRVLAQANPPTHEDST